MLDFVTEISKDYPIKQKILSMENLRMEFSLSSKIKKESLMTSNHNAVIPVWNCNIIIVGIG